MQSIYRKIDTFSFLNPIKITIVPLQILFCVLLNFFLKLARNPRWDPGNSDPHIGETMKTQIQLLQCRAGVQQGLKEEILTTDYNIWIMAKIQSHDGGVVAKNIQSDSIFMFMLVKLK